MHTHPSPRRDFEGMEHRRKRAARLFAAGKLILAAIARELRVSRQSVSRWYRDWRRGGAGAPHPAGHEHHHADHLDTNVRHIANSPPARAQAQRITTDVSTLPRVAKVVE